MGACAVLMLDEPVVIIRRERNNSGTRFEVYETGSRRSITLNLGEEPFHSSEEATAVQQPANAARYDEAELLRTYSGQLYRAAYSVLRNREDAEDAVQNCWISALGHLRSFEGRSALGTWLTRIAINSALMVLRKKRNRGEVSLNAKENEEELTSLFEVPSESLNPEESLLEEEEKRILQRAIRRLRPRSRAVVEMTQLQELSTAEAAQCLGIPRSFVKARLFHARATLRKSPTLRPISRRQLAVGSARANRMR
jgi:RNA polymerase sigma factor (sigma-70 family)